MQYVIQRQIQDFLLGVLSHWGGTNLQHRHFLVKTYAKMKELDPIGGHTGGAPWICQCNTSCHTHMHTQLHKSVFKNHKIVDTVPYGSIHQYLIF